MEKAFKKPNFAPTMMAAVPYRDMERAAQAILGNFPEAPCLPVMTRSIRWLLEGVPCLIIDRQKRQVLFSLSSEREEELFEFYDKYERGELDYFATTPQTAPFFYGMLEKLKESRPPELKWVVFRTAGAVLLGDLIRQMNGKSSFHDETLRDVLIKATNMKARWLEKKIKQEISGVEVIADLPETSLINFTTAEGTGTREDIVDAINEGFVGLISLTWIHCCANIDWSLLTSCDAHVINFDAYQHSDKVALYAQEFKAFLEAGGMIGWGIVPVIKDLLLKESVTSLVQKLEEGINLFVNKGIDEKLLVSSSWILPSCETVLLTPEEPDLVFSITREISDIMRRRYGFDS